MRRIVFNKSGGQLARCIKSSYYKVAVANFIHNDGMAASGVIEIESVMKTIKTKEVVHTLPNGKRYGIRIRKLTPRDCFRLMGVRDKDIDKLLAKEKNGNQIISNSKLYQLAGNSIVTNCMTAMFEELLFPSGRTYCDKSGQLSFF